MATASDGVDDARNQSARPQSPVPVNADKSLLMEFPNWIDFIWPNSQESGSIRFQLQRAIPSVCYVRPVMAPESLRPTTTAIRLEKLSTLPAWHSHTKGARLNGEKPF